MQKKDRRSIAYFRSEMMYELMAPNAKLSCAAAGGVGWRAKPGTNLNFLFGAVPLLFFSRTVSRKMHDYDT